MNFKLTSSQLNFYTKNATIDSTVWSQGVMELFPCVYTYRQLNDAYNRLVQANDSLRVVLKETDGETVAVVEDFRYTEYTFFEAATDEELMKKAQDFLNAPIDIYGRLVDCAVFQTPVSSGIMIRAHHIVVDGYSAFVMSEHINEYIKNPDCQSPENQAYSDYIEKEEKHKSSKRFISDKDFWSNEFSSIPDCSLFSAKGNPIDFTSDELNASLSPLVFNKIKTICSENDISPTTFFNTIYSIYLSKTLDTQRFTLGVPVLNRTTQAELNTIGLYMHLVPLVVNITDGDFITNAKEIENSLLNLFRHQKFTQKDIKELIAENNYHVPQLFDVVCDYQEFKQNDEYEMRLPYSNALSVPLEIHLQSFDEKQYNLKIRYRKSFFTENEVQQILDSIVTITDYVTNHPCETINNIPLYSQDTLQNILKFSTGLHYNLPLQATIYSLFEENSKKNADKLCIKANGKEITFGEFLKIAEQLDCEIRKHTKGEKCVIGVIADRSIEMYAAIYGIIRGGNAYMPIAPDYPQERIEYMLKNSLSPLVIAQGKYCDLANVNVIDMTAFIENPPNNDILPYACEENDTAYVIYTSGSTGKPKGAKVSHKSAVNRILWMHDKYPLAEDGVILQKTPYTFDVSVWEIFWWGMLGGSLATSKPNEHFLSARILDEVHKNKVTHLHFVPSVFDLFITYLEDNKNESYKFNTVERVFLSGEALSASLVTRFYKLFDYEKVKLHNLYGPTECAVDVTYYDCNPTDIDPVPIGKPIYNTTMYVVDKNMKLVPIGVKGELCIGGVNVGQGYLNNPDLTAQKFIDNPFGEGKLYKTGDLACWREDGNIIFCGRIDSQIKLNGQRIELGEIESVINGVEGIDFSAVIVRSINGRDILVAYCCGSANASSIKETCAKKLPSYMVPTGYAFLENMPLNASGKLDRKLLATYNFTEERTELQPPQNETEKQICDIFSKALNIAEIGRNSDFFEFGGTSLSMISVLSEDIFKDVSAPEFIANATPEKLAKALSSKKQQFCFVKPLYEARNADKALILFPYAGGNAEAYASFVKEFSKKQTDFSLYFVNFLHTNDECVEASQEIFELARKYKIYFYSHCAGSSLAMKLLNVIEESNPALVNHYIAGASIPLKKPLKNNIWNYIPDFLMKKILESSGANFKGLSKKRLSEIFDNFRKDTDFMTEYFLKNTCKITCPISLIMSKTDPFTKDFINAEALWSKYALNINNLRFIESDSHYFQSSNYAELVDIITSIIG